MTTIPTSTSPDRSQEMHKVAVGIDFSAGSQHALEVARRLFPDALIRLIHVVDARAGSVPDLAGGGTVPSLPTADLLTDLSREDARRLDALTLDEEEQELVIGDPASGLVQAAQEWGAGVLVVSTVHKGAIEHFFSGSVAEAVVRQAGLPILVIPHGGHQ
jgi:nucleotide-binding universal stress UspA family protein